VASLCVQFWSSVLHCQEELPISEMSQKQEVNVRSKKQRRDEVPFFILFQVLPSALHQPHPQLDSVWGENTTA